MTSGGDTERARGADDEVILDVAADTLCIRVPAADLPIGHTRCYVLRGGDSHLVIDPGWDSPDSERVLLAALADAGVPLDSIVGIVVTHSHRDHVGLAPALARHAAASCWVGMHAAELEDAGAHTTATAWRDHEEEWLDALGVPDVERAAARIPDEGVQSVLRTLAADRPLADGDEIRVGDRLLRILHTPGHTPGSVCVVDEERRLLFTGDTLLPRISPNVTWAPDGPDDPLGDYLGSLRRLERFDGFLALPGHEWEFDTVGERAAGLRDHHAERADEVAAVAAVLGRPTPWEVAERLRWSRPWSTLSGFQRRIAAGEAAAHLRHLERTASSGGPGSVARS